MSRIWAPGEPSIPPAPANLGIRELVDGDEVALGRLFWLGFGADGDDGYETLDDAVLEARETMAGKWGPVIWAASLLVEGKRSVAAASVVVRDDAHQLRPLLAFVVTDPEQQRRGIGQHLIQETIIRLDGLDIWELHLAVNRRNPALRLYRRLGFRVHEPPDQRPK